jgi:hypothetical protein
MKLFKTIVNIFVGIISINACQVCKNVSETKSNQCIQFTVSSGTGCSWMCTYCTNQLGTNNYYFTDNVCSYQEGQGCIGNPISGKTYTCCSL